MTGDISGDDDSDQQDFVRFQACYSGNGQAYDPGCEDADLDGDTDVDLTDFNVFISGMAGPMCRWIRIVLRKVMIGVLVLELISGIMNFVTWLVIYGDQLRI